MWSAFVRPSRLNPKRNIWCLSRMMWKTPVVPALLAPGLITPCATPITKRSVPCCQCALRSSGGKRLPVDFWQRWVVANWRQPQQKKSWCWLIPLPRLIRWPGWSLWHHRARQSPVPRSRQVLRQPQPLPTPWRWTPSASYPLQKSVIWVCQGLPVSISMLLVLHLLPMWASCTPAISNYLITKPLRLVWRLVNI